MNERLRLMIGRFARLGRRSDETWQGGLVRLRSWVETTPDAPPVRPWAGVWVSTRTGMINVRLAADPAQRDPTAALEALLEFGLKHTMAGCRPSRLEVADEALGRWLVETLGDRELALAATAELPVLDRVLREVSAGMQEHPPPPDALDAPGVTVERMRAFAGAARRFYEAAPWRHLTGEDLVHVEAPAVSGGLRHCTVLGAGGTAFGLAFFASARDFERMGQGTDPREPLDTARWSVLFGRVDEIPFGDADLWEAERLPLAGDAAYPLAIRFGPGDEMRRPDARRLAEMEGLLSAFARTSEDDIDGGRWTMEVPTADGARSFTLCIPPLLAPVDAPPGPARKRPDRRTVERALVEVERFVGQLSFEDPDAVNEAVRRRFTGPVDAVPSTATTPLERAQELMYRAFGATGRRRIQLARRALALSPDCADAHVALAEHASDPDQARAHYAAGVAAGERALGPEVFAGDAGHFWSRVATRPYMRARFGLAQCLEETGRTEEALPHYRDLLRLDPEDHLGVRHVLLAALLAAGRDDEAGALLTRYDQAPDAVWAYGAALWTFRREGDGAEARARLAAARRANRHAPPHLTGEAEWEAELPETYAYGSEEEAVLCAALLRAPWQATPGAEAWLRAQAGRGGGRARRRRR